MFGLGKVVALGILLIVTGTGLVSAAEKLGLGKKATTQEIAGWDIDIRPDGAGLPEGSGTAFRGEDVYVAKCASCHGDFGEGVANYPPLAGGLDSIDTEEPVKTVGSYWPYASTVFDYIRRAMPFGHAQSLSDDDVYAITAYVLNSSDIIDTDFVLDAKSLPKIVMPNHDGFIKDERPDVPVGEPCMTNCLASAAKVVSRARQIDVTPEDEKSESTQADTDSSTASTAGDPSRGEKTFAVCAACHSVKADEHKFGPSLAGIIGRKAASVSGFSNYSAALKAADIDWTDENLLKYMESPNGLVAGTSMPFGGIKDPAALADLLAYIKAATAQ